MVRILLVPSGSDHWTLNDGARHPTGYWAEEFVVPHRTFCRQGVEVDTATPGGVRPTVDQVSLDPQRLGDTGKAADLRSYLDSIVAELARPMAVEHLAGNATAYDASYMPGGHGPMEDLSRCAPLGRIITELHDAGRVVTAVCHGLAGLLAANRQDSSWLFQGRRMTGFTNEEERLAGLAPCGRWLLEGRLREHGALFRAGPPWQSHVVADGNLITGQNPASSRVATDRTLGELEVRT